MKECKKAKKIGLLSAGLLLLLGCAVSCSKKDTPASSAKSPTHLKVSVELSGATADMPSGDGSGGVNITVSAQNATTYQVILPTEGNKIFTLNNPGGGKVSYAFTSHPNSTTTYPVKVIAYNGSVSKDTSFSVKVYCQQMNSDVAYWLTTPDKTVLFQPQNVALNFKAGTNGYETIQIDAHQKYQRIDGFGYTLTGGSATLINGLEKSARAQLLRELFATDGRSIGVSYLRLSMGASDLSQSAFSYDDTPGDTELKDFSIDREKKDLIPVLQQILAINPAIKILATPWSAPAWMKSNGSLYGGGDHPGVLLPAYYKSYANYFVKYIQAMADQGIKIDAVTPQNEPLNAYNNPSMLMEAASENDFIKNYLAPAFQAAAITTKIIVYDHNLDHPEYATEIFSDPATYQAVDGAAFHLYAGEISQLSKVHEQFPEKHLYFTEQYTSASGDFGGDLKWHVQNLIIGATKNWSKNVLEWNLASDPNNQPHLEGGCSDCLGAVTISGQSVSKRNQSYYIIAHAAKFVRPGSVRIASSAATNLPSVAFLTPDGKLVLIVLNTAPVALTFNIGFQGKIVTPTMAAGAVATFVWQ